MTDDMDTQNKGDFSSIKISGKKVIAAWMVLLLFCLAGCGSQNGASTVTSDTGEQSSVSEQPTESPSANLAYDSAEAGAESSDGEEGSKSVREMTMAELMQTFTVEGCSLPIPCQVKDMGEGLSLGEGATLIDGTVCGLMYNGKELGHVTMPEVVLETDGFEDMSIGYEDAWVTTFSISVLDGTFEMSGVTFMSTPEEIINLLGEPDYKNDVVFEYYDYDERTGETVAAISFGFVADNKLTHVIIGRELEVQE